jgi:hypothetical protein
MHFADVQVYTPYSLGHSLRLPVTKIYFADERLKYQTEIMES